MKQKLSSSNAAGKNALIANHSNCFIAAVADQRLSFRCAREGEQKDAF
jgi:hypothetical protein